MTWSKHPNLASDVQTVLPQLRAVLEAVQSQLSREIEAMRQEASADVAALRSEVGQLSKAADEAEGLAHEAQKQLAAEMEQLKDSSEEVKAKKTEQERAIAGLKANQSRIAQIPVEMLRMQADLARVTSEVQTALLHLRTSSKAAQRQLSREIEAMREEANAYVAALRSELGYFKTAEASQPHSFQAPRAAVPPQRTSPQAPPAAPKLDSCVSSRPPLFDEFREKRFVLLSPGSHDGFGAEDFHRRCDGRANTLTLILDAGGNILGGFTPLE
jgi:hypothetical protein